MHTSVNTVFPTFSKRFEGYVHWMYLDIKGLVTIGIGNLIDTVGTVKNLPFTDKVTGIRATQAEIIAEWTRIKGMRQLAQKGYKACEAETRLRVSDEAIAALVRERLRGNEALLRKTFPSWETWPADAQLGVLSVAWAVGAGFASTWPKFTAACLAGDWPGARDHCRLREQGNPGVIPRNQANRLLFANALEVTKQGLEPSRLYYPEAVRPAVAPQRVT